ncbi:hypothetical protein CFP56_009285 [Quercus suber]|uniref:Uncharacterized protein n=1 Tax=Quercus suber TaxID=58331 RepID=A0AAW0L2I4_QUESU
MARQRAKKTVKKVESSPVNDGNDIIENEAQFDKEVERQSGAIRAIRDVEIELGIALRSVPFCSSLAFRPINLIFRF